MRKIRDKMFENKKLSILIPILISALLYVLFVIFGVAEDKMNLMIGTLIVCVFWFFGVFLVIYVQVRNPRCPERFLDFCELLVIIVFGVSATVEAISFIISGFQNFNSVMCTGFITYASVSWVHSKRKK